MYFDSFPLDFLGYAICQTSFFRPKKPVDPNLCYINSQGRFYGYLLTEVSPETSKKFKFRATTYVSYKTKWRWLDEVVGCIVSITPLRSTVQLANFPGCRYDNGGDVKHSGAVKFDITIFVWHYYVHLYCINIMLNKVFLLI